MSSFFSRFSKSFTICGAAVCAALVLFLQNSDSCVNGLKEQLADATYGSLGRDVPQTLQKISHLVNLERLDHAEKELADRISDALSETLAERARDPYAEPVDEPELVDELEPESVEESQDAMKTGVFARENATLRTAAEAQAKTPTAQPADISPDGSAAEAQAMGGAPLREKPQRAQPVAPMLQMPARDRHRSVLKDEDGPTSLAINAPPYSLSMVEALEYALGSDDKRRVPTPSNRPPLPRKTQISSPDETSPPHDNAHRQPPSQQREEQAPRRRPDTRTPDEGQTADAAAGPSTERVQPEPPAAKLQTPPAAPETATAGKIPPMRYRIQMVGDSMMDDLGRMVHSAMRGRKGVEFILSAKPSTGLSRPDYFNWPVQLRGIVERYKPDLVVFFFGANDSLPVLTEEGSVPIGGKRWRDAYAKKMAEMVEIVRAAGGDVIWIQMPALGVQRYKYMREIQMAQRDFCEKSGVASLCADDAFSGEWGRFEPFGNFHGKYVRLRTKDMAHVTREGNLKLIEHLMPILEERMARFYEAHPERRLSAEEIAHIHKVPAVVVTSSSPPRVRKKEYRKEKTAAQAL